MVFWRSRAKKKTPHELVLAGDYAGALKGYKFQLKKSKHKDPQIMLKIADIYIKLGNSGQAKDYYITVGDIFGEKGFFNKSVAAFKKALNISPDDERILHKLAAFHNKVPKYMLDEKFLQRMNILPEESAENEFETQTADVDLVALNGAQTEATDSVQPAGETEAPAVFSDDSNDSFDQSESIDFEEAVAYEEEDEWAGALSDEEGESGPAAASALLPEAHQPDLGLSLDGGDDEDDGSWQPAAAGEEPESAVADNSDSFSLEDEGFEDSFSIFHEGVQPDEPPDEASLSFDEEDASGEPDEAAAKVREIRRETDKMIFTTRKDEVSAGPAQSSLNFGSLDEALDSLFDTGMPGPPDPPKRVQNSRHWPLFRTMATETFIDFVKVLESRDFQDGESIVEQGDPGEEMFLIAEGEVGVTLGHNGGRERVALLKAGDFFGEASVLTGQPRNASVHAVKTTSCLVLQRTDLLKINESHPAIMETIRSIYYTRVKFNASLLN